MRIVKNPQAQFGQVDIAVIIVTFIAITQFIGLAVIWLLFILAGVFLALRALMLNRINGTPPVH